MSSPITVGVVNQSTVVTDADVRRMTAAVNIQVRRDFAPRWFRVPAPVRYYHSLATTPADVWLVVVLDDADQAGALGYHDETPDGRPYARVFAKPTLANGGTVLVGANSVSVTLSHEVLELLADPNVNLWADDGAAREIALEVGDPVEATSYDVTRTTQSGTDVVAVSNFVLQSYFDVQSQAGVYDFLGLLHRPWSMLPGGYLITRSASRIGETTARVDIETDGEYPSWRQATKLHPVARTTVRLES